MTEDREDVPFIWVESGGSYIPLPEPSYKGYSNVQNELSRSDRNVSGFMIKERVVMKHSFTLEWKGLTADQKNELLALTEPNSFGIKFFDVMTDQIKYISASAGGVYRGNDLKLTPYGTFDTKTNTFPYYDVFMSLIER